MSSPNLRRAARSGYSSRRACSSRTTRASTAAPFSTACSPGSAWAPPAWAKASPSPTGGSRASRRPPASSDLNNQGIHRSTVFDSLFARERLGSTGLGQGIAIPHGRIKGLKEATGAFLRLATPVQFDAPDGKPVSMLFVLLVPEQANEQHLQLLSELAQMFSERHFREALSSAPDSAAIHDLFANWGPDAPDQRRAAV